MKQKEVLAPDYYPKFHCIGSACEDSCCVGWNITVDEASYRRYQSSQHEELAPLFREGLIENTDEQTRSKNNAATIKRTEDGRCVFLQTDDLCSIHRQLGEAELSDACATYPRYANLFGGQMEYSLGISCPEAARLVLLHPEPISFVLIEPDPELERRGFVSRRFPAEGDIEPSQTPALNDFRALIIGLLQYRELSLGARLMTLGFLLEDADKVLSSPAFRHTSELEPVMESYLQLLANPASVESQFQQIEANLPRKLNIISSVLSQLLAGQVTPRFRESLISASSGLTAEEGAQQWSDAEVLAHYGAACRDYYTPYFSDKDYILENYLVNQVLTRLFPFTIASYLELYRELVCNFAIVQASLVGIAAHHRGLNDERVLQLLQSFARKTIHNPTYLSKLQSTIGSSEQDAFVDIMWILKDAGD